MSDTPQGPGWWLASDGKYYAPEQAAPPQPAPPPQPAVPPPIPPPIPPAQAQPTAPQPPAKKSGGKGCIYALIAVAAVIVLGVIGVVVALVFAGGTAVDKIQDAAEKKPCTFVTDDEISSALGSGTEVVQLSGFYSLLAPVTDTRVLADADTCIVVNSGDNTASLARIARYQASDASAKFATEKDIADGTSQDQGNGLSVETESYISDQPVTVGDEGFCTTSTFTGSSGALVRRGNTLVYVSLGTGSSSTETDSCTEAQALADKILG